MSMRGCTVSMMGPIVSERTVPKIPVNPPLFDIELKSPESPDSAISERLFLPLPLPESPSEAIVPVFVSVPSVASAVRSVLSLMEESTSVWFAASAALLISSSSGATISFRLSLNSMPISPYMELMASIVLRLASSRDSEMVSTPSLIGSPICSIEDDAAL